VVTNRYIVSLIWEIDASSKLDTIRVELRLLTLNIMLKKNNEVNGLVSDL
jgi:hypothetical protein